MGGYLDHAELPVTVILVLNYFLHRAHISAVLWQYLRQTLDSVFVADAGKIPWAAILDHAVFSAAVLF